ncbi:peptidylprolyl isomerase [Inhella gelatinilytica]|uniref:peptidylprolyl isomerase n=1 Tax=Inhella gelatinilytica TaxID=2795030 RepID=A0A931J0Y7_9BURK|nr:peptidylprolyl isomerase [Inhella gelatinilytica]MBH9553508.1 peptidylprolyl isomerase [Inhella gelatinilytica]
MSAVTTALKSALALGLSWGLASPGWAAPSKSATPSAKSSTKPTTKRKPPVPRKEAVAKAIASGQGLAISKLSPAEVLAAAPADAWRTPAAENVVQMEVQLATGAQPILFELAPRFAPQHAANIRALVREGYFDGLAILRVQDNFVTQWGDAAEGSEARALPASAQAKLPAEFSAALLPLPFTPLSETDGWAETNGFVDGFPVAADRAKNKAWIAHCYGVIGAGRGNEADSSNGSSLYAVIGHSPRTLDLNITVVGRVLKGIEHLAALPRGASAMGFYGGGESRPPLLRARLLADIPETERPTVKVLRDDTPTWTEWVAARRHRTGWFVHNPGRVDLCSTQAPVRIQTPGQPG